MFPSSATFIDTVNDFGLTDNLVPNNTAMDSEATIADASTEKLVS